MGRGVGGGDEGGRSEIQISMLISKFISHRHGRHSISAISKPIYITAIASPRVRANFIRHTRRFFSDSAGSAPRERARTQPKGGQKEAADCICTVASHVAPAGRTVQRVSERASERGDSVRSLSASYYYSTVGHTLAAASFTYRDSPRMRRGRRTWKPRNAGHPEGKKERRHGDPPRVIDRERKKLDAAQRERGEKRGRERGRKREREEGGRGKGRKIGESENVRLRTRLNVPRTFEGSSIGLFYWSFSHDVYNRAESCERIL